MPDLRQRFRDLDALDVPDVLARARAIGPRPPMPDPGPSVGRRIATAGLALAVGLAAVFVATRLKPSEDRSPTATPSCAPGIWQAPLRSAVHGAVGDVAVTSSGDVWVWAGSNTGSNLLHLTGGAWHEYGLPPGRVMEFAASPGTIWVLNRNAVSYLTGAAWVKDAFPERLAFPRALLPFGPDDVWVASETGGSDSTSGVLHWDGTSWSDVALPVMPPGTAITALGGSAPDDVWAIGRYAGGVQPMHWDGSAWTVVAAPGVPGKDDQVTKIVASTRDDAWLMAGPHLLRWDGASWTTVRDKALGRSNQWSDLATGPSGTWVVNGGAGPQGRLQHWNGAGWDTVPTTRGVFWPVRRFVDNFRLVVVGDGVTVLHGRYLQTPPGAQESSMGPITALTYVCGAR